MATDSVNVTQGVGTQMSADLIGQIFHPTVKVEFGDPGAATQVSPANPMPVTSQVSGLTIGGLVTVVAINDATWTELPATPLARRNELNIQNDSGVDLKVNYNAFAALPSGYVGITIANGNELQYPIKDSVLIFAKSAPGSGTVHITVEEIA